VINDGQMSMPFGTAKEPSAAAQFETLVGRTIAPRYHACAFTPCVCTHYVLGRDIHASDECKVYITRLLASRKICSGWPRLPTELGELSSLKIEQGLAWAGDVGQYFFGLVDVSEAVRSSIVNVLHCLSRCQQKLPQHNLQEVQSELANALATLEIHCPSHWATITKHLLLHIPGLLDQWASFWALNELTFERYGGLLKKLATGNKRRMYTLGKKLVQYQENQLARFATLGALNRRRPRSGELQSMRTRPKWDGKAETKGALRQYNLSDTQFQRVAEAWARVDPDFDALLDAHSAHKKRCRSEGSERRVRPWYQWEPSVGQAPTAEVFERWKSMQTLERTCMVSSS
jgi:hypothetical protein